MLHGTITGTQNKTSSETPFQVPKESTASSSTSAMRRSRGSTNTLLRSLPTRAAACSRSHAVNCTILNAHDAADRRRQSDCAILLNPEQLIGLPSDEATRNRIASEPPREGPAADPRHPVPPGVSNDGDIRVICQGCAQRLLCSHPSRARRPLQV